MWSYVLASTTGKTAKLNFTGFIFGPKVKSVSVRQAGEEEELRHSVLVVLTEWDKRTQEEHVVRVWDGEES